MTSFFLYISLPFEPIVFGIKLNIHLILEYLAFFIGFRYYVFLRKKSVDPISSTNRLSILIRAVFDALVLSRLVAFFEKFNKIMLKNEKAPLLAGLFVSQSENC